MQDREMYDEITALVGTVAKAFDTSEGEVVAAIEQGRLGMELQTDDEGQNYVAASLDGRNVRIYPGAIFREGDAAPESTGGCGGGCSCGH